MNNTIKNKIKSIYNSIRYSNVVGRVLYAQKTRVKIVSTLIFTLLFFFICAVFEFFYPQTVFNQINNIIDKFFWLGVK